ncbi:MAG: Uma2 family endonuclease [Microcystaceae cyanobacterium]
MTSLQTKIITDTWLEASWLDFIQATENPDYEKGKFYYDQGKLRIEMSPVGNGHANDHSTMLGVIHLYLATHDLNLTVKDNCSYRKTGQKEAQPDISCYVGEKASCIPFRTGVVDLDQFPPPDLVIEIANTSLTDDQGKKRLLYGELGISEYWIVDVQTGKILAFKMANKGIYPIRESVILINLQFSILEEALKMTRNSSHSQVMKWLLTQFNQ